jgi:hypothetical protein
VPCDLAARVYLRPHAHDSLASVHGMVSTSKDRRCITYDALLIRDPKHASNVCSSMLWGLEQVAVLSPVCLNASVMLHNQGLKTVFVWCNAQQQKPAKSNVGDERYV